MSRHITLLVLLVFAVFLLTTVGCSKITLENYEKIEVGMTYDEVVTILGTPDESHDVIGTKSCIWGEEPEIISIKIVGDKVIFHSAKGLK